MEVEWGNGGEYLWGGVDRGRRVLQGMVMVFVYAVVSMPRSGCHHCIIALSTDSPLGALSKAPPVASYAMIGKPVHEDDSILSTLPCPEPELKKRRHRLVLSINLETGEEGLVGTESYLGVQPLALSSPKPSECAAIGAEHQDLAAAALEEHLVDEGLHMDIDIATCPLTPTVSEPPSCDPTPTETDDDESFVAPWEIGWENSPLAPTEIDDDDGDVVAPWETRLLTPTVSEPSRSPTPTEIDDNEDVGPWEHVAPPAYAQQRSPRGPVGAAHGHVWPDSSPLCGTPACP